MNTSNNTKKLLKMALIIATYVAVTAVIAPFAFGNIQFRLSEVMVLLAFIDPLYIPALTIGCAISNFLLSPMAIVDMIFGSLASLIAVVLIWQTKKALTKKEGYNKTLVLFIASLWATISNALIIGAELYYMINLPFWLSVLQVAIGEFVVVSIIGVLVFKFIIKNENLSDILKIN
ncbi:MULTISPECIES: QueT transporter family protein [unclassified Clostridium]|uniref:QueT transporter family protein n=2 Tax=Clostridium TaxID=1485 RepID=UPI000E9F1942|nr:QueT transporter family protein [Clostridium sp.]